MAGIEGIPEITKAQIEQLGAADIVIGLAGDPSDGRNAVDAASRAVEKLQDATRAVIVYAANSEGGQTEDNGPAGEKGDLILPRAPR